MFPLLPSHCPPPPSSYPTLGHQLSTEWATSHQAYHLGQNASLIYSPGRIHAPGWRQTEYNCELLRKSCISCTCHAQHCAYIKKIRTDLSVTQHCPTHGDQEWKPLQLWGVWSGLTAAAEDGILGTDSLTQRRVHSPNWHMVASVLPLPV